MKKAIIALASVVTLAACHANYDKTPSGLPYKIIHTGSTTGMKLSAAKFVKVDMEYSVLRRGKDSVLSTTFGKFPQYAAVDTGARTAYSYMEVLHYCSVGDSVIFNLSADTLRKHNINLPVEIFPKGSSIKGIMKVVNAFTKREDIMADVTKEQAKSKGKEDKVMQDYMAKNHLTGQKTANGVYVCVQQPGEGPKAELGKVAFVKYRGYLLSGEVFDTNMDSTKGHTQPYPVNVGAHGVIPGWEEALPYFAKGGKGIILVPSELGYGQQGNQAIPPNSILAFDMEVTDVQAAPPAQQQMQLPAAPQQAQPQPGNK